MAEWRTWLARRSPTYIQPGDAGLYAWPAGLFERQVYLFLVTTTRHANNGHQTQVPARTRHLCCANCKADIAFGSVCLCVCQRQRSMKNKSSATANSTARPSCLVGVLWHLSGDKAVDLLINSYSTTCTKLAMMKPTEFRELTQNNCHYNVQGRSRSPILVPIESPYDFLVINSNLPSILHRFHVTADYMQTFG